MTADDLLARLEREARKAWLEGETSDVLDAAAAEVRALTARLDAVRATVNDFAGAGSRVTYSGMDVAMVFESLLDRAATADPTPQTETPVCSTCQDRGWVWVDGTPPQGTPADCPDCPTGGPADPTPQTDSDRG